jgi:UPF0176 protein
VTFIMHAMDFTNIAAYKFVALPDYLALRQPLREKCQALELKGTILIASEGINLFLAGSDAAIGQFLEFLQGDALFAGRFTELEHKRSVSDHIPFRRMLVRVKKEIVTMRVPTIAPAGGRAPAVSATTLRRWLDAGHDDQGKPVTLLDTRNAFEVELGSFDGARQFSIDRFGEFPDALRRARADAADGLAAGTVVTFCTGGIRCEKAALFMRAQGMDNVVQLDGGILRYFEEVGPAHWHGECFVFDDRVALDPSLTESHTVQCYACRSVVTQSEQADARYKLGVSCPHCAASELLQANR